MARRIIAALMLTLTLALTFVPTFAATSDGTSMPLDTTTVEQDFLVSGFEPEDFYKEHTSQEPTIAFTTDYYDDYYQTNPDGGKFYLYIWIYYPNMSDLEKKLLNIQNCFKVHINTGFEDSYGNSLTDLGGVYLGSDSTYSFHKVRVDCSLLNLNIENERKYEILSFEFDGKKYPCAKTYAFTGTHKDKNIVSNMVFDQVVHLEPKDTVYITATSDKTSLFDNSYRTAIYSVYFTVSKQFEDKNNFDQLYEVEISHYEQLFNAVVTNYGDLYTELKKMEGKVFPSVFGEISFFNGNSNYDEDYLSVYVDAEVRAGTGPVIGLETIDCLYTINPENWCFYGDYIDSTIDSELLNIFAVENYENEDLLIPFENIENFFPYTENGKDSTLKRETLSLKEEEDYITVKSYSGTEKSLWESFVGLLNGFNDMYEANLENASPIVKVDDSFFDGYDNLPKWCGDHLVAEQDAEMFKEEYDAAKKDGNVMYVLRFAKRDYYAADCAITDYSSEAGLENGFYVRATAFNDFDIITLTYRRNDGKSAVVPVNMTPIDIGPDIVGPTRTTWSDFEIFLGDLFEPILTLLGILFVLLVIIILAKPVGWIIDRLFGRRKQ